ncbi:MAG: hypothetical protein L4877_04895 [Aigarchaeota archaeon]|nr:hypothetical protein [Candidatus Geocrenenecus dongiae]
MRHRELLVLLGELDPDDFLEEVYVMDPPIVILRNIDDDIVVVAMNEKGSRIIENSRLRKFLEQVDKDVYITEKTSTVNTFDKFSWFIKVSWRNERVRLLWNLINIYHGSRNQDEFLKLIYEKTNSDLKNKLEHFKMGLISLDGKQDDFLKILGEKLEEIVSSFIPSRISQKIMEHLCMYGESTIEELSRSIVKTGVTLNTVYKTISRLKRDQYIKIAKYVRVCKRGPMRELLTSNCDKCFYNFTSHDSCYRYSLMELSATLKALYKKTLTQEELKKLYVELKTVPYPQRVVRKISYILAALHVINRKLNDRLINSMLSKIKSITGLTI